MNLSREHPWRSFRNAAANDLIEAQLAGMESYLDGLLDRNVTIPRHLTADERKRPGFAPTTSPSGIRYLWPKLTEPLPAVVLVPDVSGDADVTDLARTALSWSNRGIVVAIVTVVPRAPHRWVGAPWGSGNRELMDRREWLWRLATPIGESLAGSEVASALKASAELAGDARVDASRIAVAGLGAGAYIAALAGLSGGPAFSAVVLRRAGESDPIGDLEAWDTLYPLARAYRQGDALLAALGKRLVLVVADGEVVPPALVKAGSRLWRSPSGETPTVAAAVGDVLDAKGTRRDLHLDLLPAVIARDQTRAFAAHETRLRRRQVEITRSHQSALGRNSKSDGTAREGLRNLLGQFPPSPASGRIEIRLKLADHDMSIYEVLLPIHKGSFLRGLLGIPEGLVPGERRPAIHCQHGWQGSPEEVFGPRLHGAITSRIANRDYGADIYAGFAETLTRAGYVTWAPQAHVATQRAILSMYRKCVLLGGTDIGLLVSYFRRGLDFVTGLSVVDADQLGYYGLSYGGCLAFWYGAIEDRFKAIVSSGFFNRMSSKLTDPDHPATYMHTNDRQMYMFGQHLWGDMAELGSLIYPRPLMIELGRDDIVTPYPWVMQEYRRLRRVYASGGHSENLHLQWGKGGHQVFADKSINFLKEHLPPVREIRGQHVDRT